MKNLGSVIALLALAAVATAAPIRVGIFKGVGPGTGTRWHESTHPGSAAIAAMLTNPAEAGLQDLPIPSRGFSIAMFGVDTSCHQNGCAPSAEQVTAFIAALDTLDVVIFPNNTGIGNAIVNPDQRQRLNTFWQTRGVIGLYASVDTRSTWALWDSIHGARFSNWLAATNGTVHLDTADSSPQLPSWKYLNRGLSDTARLVEEWILFADSGTRIRSRDNLIPTLNLNESSLGAASGSRMGDHPVSWYRELPEGGRFSFTQAWDAAPSFTPTIFSAGRFTTLCFGLRRTRRVGACMEAWGFGAMLSRLPRFIRGGSQQAGTLSRFRWAKPPPGRFDC